MKDIPTTNLYHMLLTLLQKVKTAVDDRTLYKVDMGDQGDVDVRYEGEIAHFHFPLCGRCFTLGVDKVLVENVKVPDSALTTAESQILCTYEEEELYRIVAKKKYSSKINDTVEVIGARGQPCLVTLTKHGVVADFTATNVQLFFQFGSGRIKAFPRETAKQDARRKGQLEKEKKRAMRTSTGNVGQLGYEGETETVDKDLFKHKLVCECGNVRWLRNSDVFQCRFCKPCTKKNQGERKKERRNRGPK